jgi:hypothetical protein
MACKLDTRRRSRFPRKHFRRFRRKENAGISAKCSGCGGSNELVVRRRISAVFLPRIRHAGIRRDPRPSPRKAADFPAPCAPWAWGSMFSESAAAQPPSRLPARTQETRLMLRRRVNGRAKAEAIKSKPVQRTETRCSNSNPRARNRSPARSVPLEPCLCSRIVAARRKSPCRKFLERRELHLEHSDCLPASCQRDVTDLQKKCLSAHV